MNRQELETLIYDTYGVQADYPFERYLSVAAFRHTLGRKWFMTVPKSKPDISYDLIKKKGRKK